MGLGSLLRRAVAPAAPAQTRTLQTWDLGGLRPGGVVGMPTSRGQGRYRGAMSVPGAWRASVLLSDLIGRLPWHLYEDIEDEAGHRLPTPPLLRDPSPPDSRMVTFAALAMDVLWHGNGVGLVAARDIDGFPTAMLPFPAEYVQVDYLDDPLPGVPAGTPRYWIGGRSYLAHQVIHIKGPAEPGALRGMGVLEAHLSGALDLAADLERYASGISTSAVPSALIKVANPDLTEGEAAALKQRFVELQRTRSPMVLNPTTDVTPLAWDPTEMQLLEARKFSLHQVALIFGLDPSWLGAAQTSRVYSNLEMEGINLTRYSAGGLIARVEGELTRHMPPRQWVRASLDAELRPDTETRYRAHAAALAAGFLSVDEVRALENRAPLGRTGDPAAARIAARVSATEEPADEQPTTEAPADEAEGAEGRTQHERDEADLWIYWVEGEGLARWSTAKEPLAELYRMLLRHMTPERAAAAALAWFKDGLGRDPTWKDGEVPDAPDTPGQPPKVKQWIANQKKGK